MNQRSWSQCLLVDETVGRTAGTRPTDRLRPRKTRKSTRAATEPRYRMVEAMLANIGEQGYATTVVADVIAKAVASRKTFYEQFEDKQACFFALSDDIVEEWVGRVECVEGELDNRLSTIDAIVHELFALALESPPALRILAVELTTAGAAGMQRRERALERLARPLCEALGDDSPDSALLARIIVGAIVRLLYARARRGACVRRPRSGDLLALAPEVAAWASGYRLLGSATLARPAADGTNAKVAVGGRAPGTLSLGSRVIERRGLPRGEGNVSRSFVVHNQRERILDALTNLSAAKGFGSITIPEIVQEAAVSVQAFYEHFSGREDAFLVAYELGHRKALGIVERAYESQQDWPAGVRVGIVALLDFLASEPAYAHLALIDALTASPKAAAGAHDGMSAYACMLEPGLELGVNGGASAAVTIEITAGALLELCFVYVATEKARELPTLGELAGDIALRPFVGVRAP